MFLDYEVVAMETVANNCFQPGEQGLGAGQASVSPHEQCSQACAISTRLISGIPETRLGLPHAWGNDKGVFSSSHPGCTAPGTSTSGGSELHGGMKTHQHWAHVPGTSIKMISSPSRRQKLNCSDEGEWGGGETHISFALNDTFYLTLY